MTEVKGSSNFLKRLKKDPKTKVMVDLNKTMLNENVNYNTNSNNNNNNNNNNDLNLIISPASSATSSTSSSTSSNSTSSSSYLVPMLSSTSSTSSNNNNNNNNGGGPSSTSSTNSNLQVISESLVFTSQVLGGSVNSLSRSLSSRSIDSSSSSQTKVDGKENLTDANSNRKILIQKQSSSKKNIKYGELLVLGHNGYIKNSDSNSNKINCASSRRKSKFSLKIRDKSNGVKPWSQHIFQNNQEANVSFLFLL